MEASQIVDRIERTPSDARALLKSNRGVAGVNQAFFERVAALMGSNPAAAQRLASKWGLFARHGDEPSYAYRAKGVGERLAGVWSKSAESFQEAGRLASDPVARLSFQAAAVDGLARAGRIDEAVKLGRRLALGLSRLGEHGLAGRVRLNVGNALMWGDRYAAARRWFEGAIKDLDSEQYAVESAAAKLGLSTAELFGGHPGKARNLAEQAKAAFEGLDLPYFADLCALNLAHEALLRGRADEALDLLLELRESLQTSPPDEARVMEFLGDAYLRLNLFEEALDSYESALRMPVLKGMPLDKADCELGKAQALLQTSELREALRTLRKAARRLDSIGNEVWAAATKVEQAQCLRVIGDFQEARTILKEAIAQLEKRKSRYHLALARLEEAELLLAMKGDPLPAIRAARSRIDRHGYMHLAWRPHSLLGRAASNGKALGHYRRMFRAMVEGRMLVVSTTARANFLRDKSSLLGNYVGALLEKPTRKRIEEATRVIREFRAASLLDELVSARGADLQPRALRELQSLRDELGALTAQDLGPGNVRRSSDVTSPNLVSLRRRWIELTRDLQKSLDEVVPVAAAGETAVLAEANDRFYGLHRERVSRLGGSRSQLERQLKWLEFELMEPMADREADPRNVTALLRQIGSDFVTPLGREVQSLSPDGLLWRIPWQVCYAMEHEGLEPVLLTNPSLGHRAGNATLQSGQVAIWCHETPDLPNVKREAELFLSHFPQALVCRNEHEVREMLEGAKLDLLHIATHARINHSNPMFSYLEFEGGRVYATEIAKSKLQLDLVTLSACETGTMTLALKDEPDGLARAFLSRAARAVIASAWPLDDEAALVTMKPFYKELKRGSTIADSLSRARQLCRDWRGHPYFWGPLVIFGGYGRDNLMEETPIGVLKEER